MLKELSSKYIQKTERVFEEIKINRDLITINEKKIVDVVETAKRYLKDAKYYQGMEKLETSLVSVAYCEGLLDALRFLGIVEFTW
ncbi:DUF357 domain-containing protein [Candidatus Bathyarchaeota archaeon]|jgi:FAD synthetase|nr:DUF357 domain-containing protein [Candidatus Bathyarchaeota archaeon]